MLAENLKAKVVSSKSSYFTAKQTKKVEKILLILRNWAKNGSIIANTLVVGIQESQLGLNDTGTSVGNARKHRCNLTI